MTSECSDKSCSSLQEFQDIDDNSMAKDILELTDPDDGFGKGNDWWDHQDDASGQQKSTGPRTISIDDDRKKNPTTEQIMNSSRSDNRDRLLAEQQTREYIPTAQAFLVDDVETQQTNSYRHGGFFAVRGLQQTTEQPRVQQGATPALSRTRRKPEVSSTVATTSTSTATTPSSQSASSRNAHQLYVDANGVSLGLCNINNSDTMMMLTELQQNQAQLQQMLEQKEQKDLRRRKLILYLICIATILVVITVGAVVGLVLFGRRDRKTLSTKKNSPSATNDITNATESEEGTSSTPPEGPRKTLQPISSSNHAKDPTHCPTFEPYSTPYPTQNPTPSPNTWKPTLNPTLGTTNTTTKLNDTSTKFPKPFETKQELLFVVHNWLAGLLTNDSSYAATYGYPIGQWDVSAITDFSLLFSGCTAAEGWLCDRTIGSNSIAANFTDDISEWNVSSAVTMNYMFSYSLLFNGDLSRWDVSNVREMRGMFHETSSFNGNISNWDVSSVTDMNFMFQTADAFTGDISRWNVSSVTNMSGMFSHADSFNSDISHWDVSNVKDMSDMFLDAYRFNGNISHWNVSNVEDMSFMFRLATSFNQDLSQWNVVSVTNMGYMFSNASSFNQDICAWGNRLPRNAITANAFLNSACPNQYTPILHSNSTTTAASGPFCYSCT